MNYTIIGTRVHATQIQLTKWVVGPHFMYLFFIQNTFIFYNLLSHNKNMKHILSVPANGLYIMYYLIKITYNFVI